MRLEWYHIEPLMNQYANNVAIHSVFNIKYEINNSIYRNYMP